MAPMASLNQPLAMCCTQIRITRSLKSDLLTLLFNSRNTVIERRQMFIFGSALLKLNDLPKL